MTSSMIPSLTWMTSNQRFVPLRESWMGYWSSIVNIFNFRSWSRFAPFRRKSNRWRMSMNSMIQSMREASCSQMMRMRKRMISPSKYRQVWIIDLIWELYWVERALEVFPFLRKYYALMFGYYAYANVMQKRYENEKGGKYVKFVFTVFNIPWWNLLCGLEFRRYFIILHQIVMRLQK